jgi:hypothetical protein
MTPAIPGHAVVREHVPLPVVGVLHGHTKSDAAISIGYYDLYCQYIRRDTDQSSITIQGITLNNYGLPSDDPQETADRILAEAEVSIKALRTETKSA